MTSPAAILGDTGFVLATEDSQARPLRGLDWARGLEEELSNSPKLRVVIIRPAWLIHGPGQGLGIEVLNNWIPLSWRFKRGTYLGAGGNYFSAIHLEDLAALYCLTLGNARRACLVHAASEKRSTKEVAVSIHRAMRLKGEPKGIPLEEARMLTPIADGLTRSQALSADYAKSTFGWTPSRDSILREIEAQAAVYALAKRRKSPATTK